MVQKYIYYIITLLSLVAITSCEGIEDWSDLKAADLFDSKSTDETANTFKRYSIPGLSAQPLVEFIVDDNNKLSSFCSKQIEKACDYTKIPYHSINYKNWNSSLKIVPTTRVICVYDTNKLNDTSITKLLDFVSNGGMLFVLNAFEDHRMSFFYGYKPEAEYETDTKSSGWFFSTPMLPSLKTRTYFATGTHYGFDAQNFSNKVKVLATALNNHKYPIIIENKIGSGKVLLYNTTTDFNKEDRGLLFAGVLKGLDGIPYPIANVATIFLDDFPSPQYEIKAEPIASEMNKTMVDYVKDVWWPDMKKIAKQYKIPYSVMTTFDYRNKIVPPFTLDQWNLKKISTKEKIEPLTDWFVKDAAKNGHEIAFHGYNHVSLLKEGWKNQQFIGTSLNAVKKKWEISNYGKLPTTYVPPSNDIDKMGVGELKKAMPSLKYMCSLFLGKKEEGGDREFDYDPYQKDFFDYPRISFGFYMSDDHKYNQQSMYLFTGIWTHFVHPDDIYQLPKPGFSRDEIADLRNGESYGWYKTKGKDKAMLPEFKKYLSQMTNTYPQIRFFNANDAAKLVINWRASRYTHESKNGVYTIKQINPEEVTKQYWFMYGSPENAEKLEAQLKNQAVIFSKTPFMDGYLYSVYTNKPSLSFDDLNYKNEVQKTAQEKLNQIVLADFSKYNVAVKKFQTGDVWKDVSAIKLKIELASLKNKMLNNAVIDSVIWNKYAKNLSWENRGEEVWKILDEHVAKYPTTDNIMYSKELDRVIGYPNDSTKEKWMNAQIQVSPNDIELLKGYVANFNIEENQEKIASVLKKIHTLENTPENYKNYIRHLLQYNPQEALKELSDKKPSEDLAELTTQIVWLFADNAMYRKAIEWSANAKDIDFVTKMSWYIETGQSKALVKEYVKYIADHPNDYKAKAVMSSVYHELGRFKDSWVLANSLPESIDKEDLRKTLNKDVVYENEPLQLDLIAHQSELFYPDVLKKLIKEDRLKRGDFIDLNTSIVTNKEDTSIQKNLISYSHFDKNSNLHTFSGTYNKYYKLDLLRDYESNFNNSLIGAQYKITSAQIDGKPQYWSRARVEVDKSIKPFYEFGIGLNLSKEKNFKSAEFNLFPIETAPGLNQKMYQMRLNIYQDFYLFKIINTSISFESDYYTNGLISRDTIKNILNPNRFARKVDTRILEDGSTVNTTYDNAIEGFLTTRFMLDNGEIKRSKFIPFIEAQYSRGTSKQPAGFPYWMIKHRLYGGGGLAWQFTGANLHTKVEGGYFLDDYSKNFKRVSGNLEYQIFDFTAITMNVELFFQAQYYSNSFQLGVKYNLKRKIKK